MVVRFAAQYGGGAIDLLHCYQSGKLVWKCHLRQRQLHVAAPVHFVAEAVRPSDYEYEVALHCHGFLLYEAGEFPGCQFHTLFIEQY